MIYCTNSIFRPTLWNNCIVNFPLSACLSILIYIAGYKQTDRQFSYNNFQPCSPIIFFCLKPLALCFVFFSPCFFLLFFSSYSNNCICVQPVSVCLFPLSSHGENDRSLTQRACQSVRIPVGLSSTLWYHLTGMILKALFRVWCSGRHSVLWLFELNSGSALGWLQSGISAHEL